MRAVVTGMRQEHTWMLKNGRRLSGFGALLKMGERHMRMLVLTAAALALVGCAPPAEIIPCRCLARARPRAQGHNAPARRD